MLALAVAHSGQAPDIAGATMEKLTIIEAVK